MTSVRGDRRFDRLNTKRRLCGLDLKLLIVFQEAMATGDTRMTADHLEMTQSAVSHALRRLSNLVGAQLFERSGGTIVPTPCAGEIRQAVDTIVVQALSLLPAERKTHGPSDAPQGASD